MSTSRRRCDPDSPAPYPATKARAELAVRRANRGGFETVTVRPRFVWGKGDTTLLPGMVATVESGGWAWIGGGRNVTDTAHVDNVVEGTAAGRRKGRPGEAYFVTDDEPVVFREFVTAMLRDPGRRASRPQPSRLDGEADGGRLAGCLEGCCR